MGAVLPKFVQYVLILAGSWELYSCHVTGCFSMEAAAHLPNCLQHVLMNSIGAQLLPYHVLDKMKRFSDLQTLQLHLDPEAERKPIFLLREPLTSLSTLQICGLHSIAIDDDDRMLQLLPQLRHLECCVFDQQLQEILNMPKLISARLEVDCWLEDEVKVLMPATV